jgi:hypothetical protein
MSPSTFNAVPKTAIEILNQEIWEDEAKYRIRAGNRVYYLTIARHADHPFDEDTLCRPYLLIPKLPPFPDSDWTRMQLVWGPGNTIKSTISYESLDQVASSWHTRHIDVLSLKRISSYRACVQEVAFEGRTAIAKIAIFEERVPRIEHETRIYETLAKCQTPNEPPIAPTFLGHLTENGRRIGFLLEKIEGHYASLADLAGCEAALRRLHGIGLLHGDTSRYNFVVEPTTGYVKMIDFEHAEIYEEDKARLEIEELNTQLTEESGRGASVVVVNGEKRTYIDPIPYY